MEERSTKKQILKQKILTIIGIVLCAILLPILIFNIIMIINSYSNKNEVPSVGKYIPFIIQSGSMSGTIEGGDIIVTTKIEAKDVKVDDIITFYDPKGNGVSTVTHRVLSIEDKNGELIFTTVGDVVLNENLEKYGSIKNIPDYILDVITEVVPEKNVISKYSFRIPLIGHISLFMSTIPGFIVCVLVPLLLLVGYDVVRRKISDKENNQDKEALLAELEALRAEKLAKEQEQNDSKE